MDIAICLKFSGHKLKYTRNMCTKYRIDDYMRPNKINEFPGVARVKGRKLPTPGIGDDSRILC